jgi:hypothetical protein
MIVQLMQEDGGGSVTGYLQDDDVGFGTTNNYSAPFEAATGGLWGVAAQLMTGGSSKFQYMFNQFWDSATPPEITLNLAFIAGFGNRSVKENINALLDIFGSDTGLGGMIVPPGGLTGLGGMNPKEVAETLASAGSISGFGTALLDILEKIGSQRRLVNVYIGDDDTPQLTFKKMLAERVEFKGKLPLIVNGDFPIAMVTCVFKKPTLLLKGERFMQ